MHKIALWSISQRNALFAVAADRMNIPPAIIEKDFWVCWMLDILFSSETWGPRLMFKGGTSLSKVFNLVNRFSEDIDLILDWNLIGLDNTTAWKAQTRTQRDRFSEKANRATADFLAAEFVPWFQRETSSRGLTGFTVAPDAKDRQCIEIAYPASFHAGALNPKIRLEIGPLADWVPHNNYTIQSYAADHSPSAFEQPQGRVRAILARRTFWEKASILHREAHREAGKEMPVRQARHYYDLVMMMDSPVKKEALGDLDLLADVVEFKQQFYPCPWAKYEQAKPGTIRLLPPSDAMKALESDYMETRAMIFGDAPTFEEIITRLGDLEKEINSLQA